jgi:hypothetical protein
MRHYQAHFEPPEEGRFVVTFPYFDWGIAQHDDEAEAQSIAGDATVIDRLFDPRRQSRLADIEAAFRALGKQIEIEVRDAA